MTDSLISAFLAYDDSIFEIVNNGLSAHPELYISLEIPLAFALDRLVKELNEHPTNNGKWMFNFDLINKKLQRTASVNNPYI